MGQRILCTLTPGSGSEGALCPGECPLASVTSVAGQAHFRSSMCPPASAGNHHKVLLTSADSYWNRGPGQGRPARGMQVQKGYGGNSICEWCNNTTGRWYAPYFADWCREGMWFYDHTGGKSAL